MRIGEAAAAVGMTTKTIRFYEDRGLLPPAERSANGYREYAQDTVSRLEFIRRSQVAGLTLAQIQDILRIRDHGLTPCAHVCDVLARQLMDLDRQIVEITALRETVAGYHAAAEAADPARCDPDRICSYL
ncbi:heavy metal-responsive transcriptional regulator [Arthrobacter russicus]|uniref:heavy metal-responsive transcriptional regulator n=1 Tax=Arthrobacter russicus TaxID=172040 RepID=UPI003CF43A71